MKAELTNAEFTTKPEIVITHGTEKIFFTTSSYNKNNLGVGVYDIFEHINLYWASLPEIEQKQIFQYYRDISLLFVTNYDTTSFTAQMIQVITNLLDMHDYQKVHDWTSFKSNIHVPETFERAYVESIDRKGSRDQTYIRSDYVALVTLAIVLRVMVPVWGEYISRTRGDNGTQFKEFFAFRLIGRSKILNSEPFLKLRRYIDKTLGTGVDRINPAAIIGYISSEDFPEWILSLVAIRRLCVGDIRGINPNGNLVTVLHSFIRQKMNGTDTPAEDMVKEKSYDNNNTDLDAKLSSLERYKIKFDISIGETTELEYIVADTRRIAERLVPSITDELLNRCLTSASLLRDRNLYAPQIRLLQWVFAPIISPRGIPFLSKPTLIRCFGVLQAALWERGFKYLALLSTSYANLDSDEIELGSGTESRARIPKDVQAELDILYPYQKAVNHKKMTQRVSKPANLAIRAIDQLAEDLSSIPWIMTADEAMIVDYYGSFTTRKIPIEYDIKSQLAMLVKQIAQTGSI